MAVRMAASKSNEAARNHEKAMRARSNEANKHYDEAAASAAEAMRAHVELEKKLMAESAHLEALKNAADKSFRDHRKAGEIAHAASAKAGMEA